MGDYMGHRLPGGEGLWHVVELLVSTAMVTVLFALGLYLGKKATESSHSAAAALIVLLLWVYYSAQIVFFGAELTRAYIREAHRPKGDEGNRG